jgi:hypothetical protein
MGLPYEGVAVNIGAGAPFAPGFQAIRPARPIGIIVNSRSRPSVASSLLRNP